VKKVAAAIAHHDRPGAGKPSSEEGFPASFPNDAPTGTSLSERVCERAPSKRRKLSRAGRTGGPGWSAWLFAAVPVLFLAVFFYMPIVEVLSRGFRTPEGGFSLAVVRALLADPYIHRLIRFTSTQALASAGLSALIGVPLAYVLARKEFPGRSLAAALTIVPFVLPSITVALGFLLTFGTNGWLNQLLRSFAGVELRILHSLWAILLAHAFYNAPVVARMVQGAWEQVDPRLEESARSLGATAFGVFRDVTLPTILPAVLSGAALAFIYSFMSFPIVLALGGARYSTLEVEIYTQVHVLWDYETGAALAAIQAVLSLAFVYVILKLQGDPVGAGGFGGGGRPGVRSGLDGGGRGFAASLRPAIRAKLSAGQLLAGIFVLFAVLFFTGPVAAVAWHSFKAPGGGLSLAGYARILSIQHSAAVGNSPLAAIGNSLRFGTGAALIALSLGLAFCYGSMRIRLLRTTWVETLALAPIVVSSIALGFGVLLAFRKSPLSAIPADWRVILVHSVLAFPFVVRTVRPVLANLDRRLTEAARTLGAGPVQAFRTVELPLIAASVFVALALAFGISVSEMSATMMLARPGLVTMPVSVYRFLSSRDFQSASAMAVVLILVTSGAFFAIERISRLAERRARRALIQGGERR